MPADPSIIDLLTASGDPQARDIAQAMAQQLRRDKLESLINSGGGKRQQLLGREQGADADMQEKQMLAAGIANQRYGAEMRQHRERMASEKERNDLTREQIRQQGAASRVMDSEVINAADGLYIHDKRKGTITKVPGSVGKNTLTGGLSGPQVERGVDKLKKDLQPAVEAKDDLDRLGASVEEAQRKGGKIPGMSPLNAWIPDVLLDMPVVGQAIGGGDEGIENRQIARRLATNLTVMKHGKRYTTAMVKDMQRQYGISPWSPPGAVALGVKKMQADLENNVRSLSAGQPNVIRNEYINRMQGSDLVPGLDPTSPAAGPRKSHTDYLKEAGIEE
jgi:phage terminase Nu1 subunit (DNA packaging protein)